MHQKLVEELLKENDLSGVANALYQHTRLPVLIESENLELLAVAGMVRGRGSHFFREIKSTYKKYGKKK